MGCIGSTQLSYETWKNGIDSVNYDEFGDYFQNPSILSRDAYIVGPVLGDGIMGIVHAGIEKGSKKFVALKFFGYFEKQPRNEDIEREIGFMTAMSGLPGAVQIHGIFMDTRSGMLHGINGEGKYYKEEYPVVIIAVPTTCVFMIMFYRRS
jgi:serine/threonine protein kinase